VSSHVLLSHLACLVDVRPQLAQLRRDWYLSPLPALVLVLVSLFCADLNATDIIEGVNRGTVDTATLHTKTGCDMSSVNQTQLMTGTYNKRNCSTSAGAVPSSLHTLRTTQSLTFPHHPDDGVSCCTHGVATSRPEQTRTALRSTPQAEESTFLVRATLSTATSITATTTRHHALLADPIAHGRCSSTAPRSLRTSTLVPPSRERHLRN
jgi:hypothetical protein